MKGNDGCTKCTYDIGADPHDMNSAVRFVFVRSDTVPPHPHRYSRNAGKQATCSHTSSLHQLDLPPVHIHTPEARRKTRKTHRLGNSHKPHFDLLVLFHTIPIEIPELELQSLRVVNGCKLRRWFVLPGRLNTFITSFDWYIIRGFGNCSL